MLSRVFITGGLLFLFAVVFASSSAASIINYDSLDARLQFLLLEAVDTDGHQCEDIDHQVRETTSEMLSNIRGAWERIDQERDHRTLAELFVNGPFLRQLAMVRTILQINWKHLIRQYSIRPLFSMSATALEKDIPVDQVLDLLLDKDPKIRTRLVVLIACLLDHHGPNGRSPLTRSNLWSDFMDEAQVLFPGRLFRQLTVKKLARSVLGTTAQCVSSLIGSVLLLVLLSFIFILNTAVDMVRWLKHS